MARRAVVEILGEKELRRTLKKAGVDMADFRVAHLQASQIVAGRAAPVTPKVTGALRQSVRPGATQTAAIVRAGSARVPYANPIHWGWPKRHIAASLFLTTTAAQTEPTWAPIYMDRLEQIIGGVKGA